MGWPLGLTFTVIAVLLFALAIYIIFFVDSPSDPCYNKVKGGMKNSGWQRPRCSYVTEKTLSPSIPTAPSVYLGKFEFSQEVGGAVCTPRWYAARLVNLDTGEYGPLGKWTLSPVIAGNDATSLPWIPNETSKVNGCNFNQPTIVTVDPIPKGYHLNLHRHLGVTPPPSSSLGKIIGVLNPLPQNDSRKWTSFMLDVANNPDTNSVCC